MVGQVVERLVHGAQRDGGHLARTTSSQTASAVGCCVVAVRAPRKMRCRCGVTFRPWARNELGQLVGRLHRADPTGRSQSATIVDSCHRAGCHGRSASTSERPPTERRCRSPDRMTRLPGRRSTRAPTRLRRRARRHHLRRPRDRRRHHRRGRARSTPRRRGLRTALVERDDFASGTSSKSSKMVHGGLRYLQQGDVRLVYEALAERQRLRRNAPHLVKILPFLLPDVHRQGRRGPDASWPGRSARPCGSTTSPAAPASASCTSASASTRRWPTCPRCAASAWRRQLPLLRRAGRRRPPHAHPRPHRRHRPRRGRRQRRHGRRHPQGRRRPGHAASSVEADGRSRSTIARHGGGERRAACGPTRCAPSTRAPHPDSIRPAKGIHITVPWSKVRNDIAVVVPVPEGQAVGLRRAVGRLHLHRHHRHRLRRADRRSAVHARGHRLPAARDQPLASTTDITVDDIVGTWAGLRPLVRRRRRASAPPTSPAATRWRDPTSGVVTVTGGKLTTYREMAADTVDARASTTCSTADVARPRSPTRQPHPQRLRLRGADGYAELLDRPASISRALDRPTGRAPRRPLRRRGPHGPRHDRARPDAWPSRWCPGSPTSGPRRSTPPATRWPARSTTCSSRRTRARLLGRDDSAAAAAEVAALIADDLGWDDAEQARQVAAYRALDRRTSAPRPTCPRPRSTRLIGA